MIDADQLARARAADLAAIAEDLGTSLRRATATERVGPCPKCGGRDRFSVNIKQQVWNCRGCGQGGSNALDLVMHVRGCNFREAVAYLTGEDATPTLARGRPAAEPSTDNGDNREKALALWREGDDPRPTVVKLYLNSRTLELDDDLAGEVLRWHPRIGAMLALFRNILTGEPQAVSRTFLDREGKKLGRKFLGPVWGAAIMLDAFDEVLGGLHAGEGVETCMAARQLGLRPCWALGSAPAVAAFPVLGGVECLTLLRENDDASERACEACAARWHAAGREVFINQPTAGKDLNDAIRSSS
jgi:Toprim domain/CHC2 zinc finger